jgi:hypothetical protein
MRWILNRLILKKTAAAILYFNKILKEILCELKPAVQAHPILDILPIKSSHMYSLHFMAFSKRHWSTMCQPKWNLKVSL